MKSLWKKLPDSPSAFTATVEMPVRVECVKSLDDPKLGRLIAEQIQLMVGPATVAAPEHPAQEPHSARDG